MVALPAARRVVVAGAFALATVVSFSVAAQQPAPAAMPAPASAGTAMAAPDTPGRWPHFVAGPNGSATIYQPQVIAWPERRTLQARMAVGITPTGAKAAILGALEVSFDSQTDLAERVVVLTNPRLVSARFPALDPTRAAQFEQRIRDALATMGAKRVPLAMVIASLRDQAKPATVAVDNTPPRIFASTRPASLVVFDGEPVWAPVQGTSLSYAVNTNWDVFRDGANGTIYLLNNGGWLMASDVKGPWMPAGLLPPVFGALPNDANFADVKKSIPGRAFTPQTVPTIFTSTTPAAIIVTGGTPQYTPIAGTSLAYVANTDAALFRDKSGTLYYLVSGRWFSAGSLDGPWTFATPTLPADFQRIPANGPRGFVRVSVPGTPEAEEALIEAQIPQQATLSRNNAQMNVVYAGEPKFAPIPGTSLAYATNTSFQVVQVSNAYYACYQGAWFTSPVATGPWVLTPTVPEVIYTIPPSSPLYPCTYVRVYASTPDTVTFGYTAGYTMGFVSAGVLVYGTGYYYPPYIYPGPIPIYYPYPYSYAGATYYNSATGAWAHGGAIYGPYGGVARGGTAYNPNTGAWAQGGAIYGPNGGAGAFSAYNPSNGSYARGSAAWGPDGAAGNANWYNANTGRSGSTQQNANAYGRWGSSTISGPNQTVHTQSQANAQGRAGSFDSSSGAKGAGVSGAGGNRAGAVQTAGGDVYAGADGNVYKKTDSGWQKYDNGSWNNVQQPQRNAQSTTTQQRDAQGSGAQARSAGAQAQSSGMAAREGAFGGGEGRTEGFGQLEQDRSARMTGYSRESQFEGMRGGGFAGRGAMGGGGGFGGRGGFHR